MPPTPSRPHTIPLADGLVDVGQQVVHRRGRTTHLTTREIELLVYLAANPQRTITREELLEAVWGHPPLASTEPVYSTIKRLRAKIDDGPHRHIATVHGDGYRYEPASPTAPTSPTAPSSPPASTGSFASNPRRPGTRFVGRETERRAITAILADGARLVTLVGPGGVGKTRLALELAAASSSRQRVVFVDLAEAKTRAEVLHTTARALDLSLDGGEAGLLMALPLTVDLLVLDNAEQVAAEVAALAGSWLDATCLLVTSRVRLAVSGEHLVELGPLPEDEAMALYLDRAALAVAGYELDASGLEALRELVRRLDGLPLAIELAAARVKTMPPAALLTRLPSSLLDLGLAPRDRPARHRTLREAIDWSFRLLSPREQELLTHSSVFSGGISLEAAEAVLGPDAVAGLEALCDRSLFRVTPPTSFDPSPRFEPWVAVHELAAERLTDPGPGRAHCRFFLEDALRWVEDLDRRGHARARAHLELELDNLRAATRRALAMNLPGAEGLTLVLARVLTARGAIEEARSALEELIAGHPVSAAAWLALGEALDTLGREPTLALEAARDLAAGETTAQNAAAQRALASAALGRALASRGDFAAAITHLHEARHLAETRAPAVLGRVRTALGEVFWRAGRVTEAEPELTGALALHQERGDLRLFAQTSATLCHVKRAAGQPAAAFEHLEAAIAGFETLADPIGRARTLIDKGLHLSRIGRQRDATLTLEEAGAEHARLGLVRGLEEVHLNLAEALLGLGEDERARREIRHAVAACRELGERLRLSVALELAGCAYLLGGDLASAEAAFEEALSTARATHNRISEATLLAKRGLTRYLKSELGASLEDFRASERIHKERGAAAMEGTATADVAVLLAALGQPEAASEASARARQLLSDPPVTHWTGRMVALLEAAAHVHADPSASTHERARATRAAVLAAMPAESQDLATRLSLLMLDHALALTSP